MFRVLPQSEENINIVSLNCTEIIVIRHGETEWNAEGRIQGHLDVELNDIGRQQAHAVADRLSREPKISVVYSSDLKRAFETAETIASSCGVLEVVKDPDLRERHLGDIQGLTVSEASQKSPNAYKAMVSRRTDQEIPVSSSIPIAFSSALYLYSSPALPLFSKLHMLISSISRVVEKALINFFNAAHLLCRGLQRSIEVS
nr:phosphoglycerate mutase-like protein 4 isoform X1 [Ipomoea batatas]